MLTEPEYRVVVVVEVDVVDVDVDVQMLLCVYLLCIRYSITISSNRAWLAGVLAGKAPAFLFLFLFLSSLPPCRTVFTAGSDSRHSENGSSFGIYLLGSFFDFA